MAVNHGLDINITTTALSYDKRCSFHNIQIIRMRVKTDNGNSILMYFVEKRNSIIIVVGYSISEGKFILMDAAKKQYNSDSSFFDDDELITCSNNILRRILFSYGKADFLFYISSEYNKLKNDHPETTKAYKLFNLLLNDGVFVLDEKQESNP